MARRRTPYRAVYSPSAPYLHSHRGGREISPSRGIVRFATLFPPGVNERGSDPCVAPTIRCILGSRRSSRAYRTGWWLLLKTEVLRALSVVRPTGAPRAARMWEC